MKLSEHISMIYNSEGAVGVPSRGGEGDGPHWRAGLKLQEIAIFRERQGEVLQTRTAEKR